MNYSGILVLVDAPHVDACAAALAALHGVEVHRIDRASGKVVVVQEAPTIDGEVEGLRRIQSLPHVVRADLVYHRFEDDAAPAGSAFEEHQP